MKLLESIKEEDYLAFLYNFVLFRYNLLIFKLNNFIIKFSHCLIKKYMSFIYQTKLNCIGVNKTKLYLEFPTTPIVTYINAQNFRTIQINFSVIILDEYRILSSASSAINKLICTP